MSIVEPDINTLLDKTEQDKFLLCTLAYKRARDINDMMRGQHERAVALQSVSEIAELSSRKPLRPSTRRSSRLVRARLSRPLP